MPQPKKRKKGKAEKQERRQVEKKDKTWTREEGFKASGRKHKGPIEPRSRRGEDSGGKEATDLDKPRGEPQGQLPQKGGKRTCRK